MPKRTLVLLSVRGFWGEELVRPMEAFAQGSTVNFMTPTGMRPEALPPSMDAKDVGNVSRVRSVIVDYPFVTSRSTPDSFLCGEKMVEVLKQGLTRWGW